MSLPFRPWWWHPKAKYVGKHRGVYQHAKPVIGPVRTMTLPVLVWTNGL